MTFEELMKKPELSPDETKKALELASRQTESCLSEFSSQFKSVYSENGFYTPSPTNNGPTASGRANCGWPMKIPEMDDTGKPL